MPKKLGSVHITLHVMPDLRQRFKLACTAKNKNMTEVLEQLMEDYATEYEKSLKTKDI
ncbi:hypothetical protein [uncultured Nostoc sp.]|jgi:hypothetical protein|uniref:ribbon-helix-helix protein n=1 Tax=uncultured Nostoc sp. TaxID=340711 RepID=UPI0035CB5F29